MPKSLNKTDESWIYWETKASTKAPLHTAVVPGNGCLPPHPQAQHQKHSFRNHQAWICNPRTSAFPPKWGMFAANSWPASSLPPLTYSVRIPTIVPTCPSCRSIMLFWSRKKNNQQHVFKLNNFNKSPTSIPFSCQLSQMMSLHELNLHAAKLWWTGQNARSQYETWASWRNVTTSPSLVLQVKRIIYCVVLVSGFSFTMSVCCYCAVWWMLNRSLTQKSALRSGHSWCFTSVVILTTSVFF